MRANILQNNPQTAVSTLSLVHMFDAKGLQHMLKYCGIIYLSFLGSCKELFKDTGEQPAL